MTAQRHPFPASALVVDLRGFGTLTNPEQLAARRRLYGILSRAFTGGGVPWEGCRREDRGDGLLVVAPPWVPKTTLLGPVLDRITDPRNDWPRRLRVAVHAGEMHHDGNGFVGTDVNRVFRLANSAPLREALERTTAPCALLVSEELYHGIVRHGYGEIQPRSYFPVPLSEKETTTTAWLRIPGDDRTAEAISRSAARPRRSRPGGIVLRAGRDQTITGSIIAAGDIHYPPPRPKRR